MFMCDLDFQPMRVTRVRSFIKKEWRWRVCMKDNHIMQISNDNTISKLRLPGLRSMSEEKQLSIFTIAGSGGNGDYEPVAAEKATTLVKMMAPSKEEEERLPLLEIQILKEWMFSLEKLFIQLAIKAARHMVIRLIWLLGLVILAWKLHQAKQTTVPKLPQLQQSSNITQIHILFMSF